MSSKNYHILVVDDDAEFHQQIRYAFRRQFLFSGAMNETQLFQKLQSDETYDLVLLDLVLDDTQEKKGLDLLSKIKAQYAKQAVIVVTADRSIDTVVEAMKLGANNFLVKDNFDFDYWHNQFLEVIESNQLKTENKQLRAEVKRRRKEESSAYPFIGQSLQIKEIKRILRLVSEEPDVSVLITGETGTGKEVAARYLHAHGARKDKPFQAVNLSAIQDTLLESTLFGHKKGAFTGATRDMEGYFNQANGGILLLDEIGDIDQNIQIKLLRFLETKEIRPVGSDKDIKLDVQVVAATHRDMYQAVQEGKFREDLYQRLKAMVVELPPLRSRRDDIPLLLAHFFETDNIQSLFTPSAYAALIAYDWIGNIRELKNAVAYMQLRAKIYDKSIIDEKCLPNEVLNPKSIVLPKVQEQSAYNNTPSTSIATNNIEEEHALIDLDRIEQLLIAKNKVKKDVAVAMGLENTDNLRYRIKKHYDKHPRLFINFPTISQSYKRIVK